MTYFIKTVYHSLYFRISSWTKDGSILAYGLSEKGSDWVTVKFRTADRIDLPDVITGVKHSSLSWMRDNSGLFYCKYPEHKGTSVEKHEYHSLYFHKMGTDCSEDVLVYDRRDHADYMIGGTVTDDGRYLIIDVSRGCDPYNLLYYYDLKAVENKIMNKIEPKPLFDQLVAKYDYIDHDDSSMLVLTNKDAPMFKLIRINITAPSTVIEEVVAEQQQNKLDWVAPVANDRMVVAYLEDVKVLYIYDDMLFSLYKCILDSSICARSCFRGTIISDSYRDWEMRRVTVKGMDERQFTVKQVFFQSKDDTKVIIVIKMRSQISYNLLYYFTVKILRFRLVILYCEKSLLLSFYLFSEYGETWHTQGMRENKQNVFDDFIGAAEFLIKEKYTSNNKLAIHGGSNGGLLVGVCSQQRPDLFAAVLNRVGVLDMLRFHKFTVGGAWIPEFGNPDDANDFKFIYKLVYSFINLNFNNFAIYNFQAKLHMKQRNPLLVRVEVKAGHGAGKPTSKVFLAAGARYEMERLRIASKMTSMKGNIAVLLT
uniref:Prolyl endopeptidase n=1 Tax=Heterorhabditis bacteriophora TaxID=37862 RepID=A0A1I7W6X8_HETBA